jgi:hypothetical protein
MTSRTVEEKIRDALTRRPQPTAMLARAGGCTLGEAVVILMRLEARSVAERGPVFGGMTWRAVR